ncbi:hypothetical protein [Mesorhizobium sp. M1348]|uniref:hypothetical protein n=1 Tax=unclassified Mesorhizobium TaxID=325217 RepID=UPI00333A1989
MLVKQLVGALLAAFAVSLAFAIGSRTRATRHAGEQTLRATWFLHVFAVLLAGFVAIILVAGYSETRSEQLPWVYGLLVGFGLTLIGWIWFFYLRVVFWNIEGVGIRQPFVPPRFIPWEDIEWAGRKWTGDFQLCSKKTSISYTAFQGGHDELNRRVKLEVPKFERNF